MYKLKLPKQIYIIKCENALLGLKSSAFCFYDKTQATKIFNHIEKTNHIDIWNTPVNPTIFLLQHTKSMNELRKNYKIYTYDSEEFFDNMLKQNISIRIIDHVDQVDKSTYSLSSFCGLETTETNTEDAKIFLDNAWKNM